MHLMWSNYMFWSKKINFETVTSNLVLLAWKCPKAENRKTITDHVSFSLMMAEVKSFFFLQSTLNNWLPLQLYPPRQRQRQLQKQNIER